VCHAKIQLLLKCRTGKSGHAPHPLSIWMKNPSTCKTSYFERATRLSTTLEHRSQLFFAKGQLATDKSNFFEVHVQDQDHRDHVPNDTNPSLAQGVPLKLSAPSRWNHYTIRLIIDLLHTPWFNFTFVELRSRVQSLLVISICMADVSGIHYLIIYLAYFTFILPFILLYSLWYSLRSLSYFLVTEVYVHSFTVFYSSTNYSVGYANRYIIIYWVTASAIWALNAASDSLWSNVARGDDSNVPSNKRCKGANPWCSARIGHPARSRELVLEGEEMSRTNLWIQHVKAKFYELIARKHNDQESPRGRIEERAESLVGWGDL
jgi:hypothetical protein